MKKHNDDWEEFLKKREKEKPIEEAELEELLKHDHTNKKTSKNNKTASSTTSNKNINSTRISNNLKEDYKNINFDNSEKDYKLIDIDSLSEEEILGSVTSYDEAYKIYEDSYAEYEKAFQNWETDPDNDELQNQLDIASNINDLAQKRLRIFQERELTDLKRKREEMLSNTKNSNKNQSNANSNSKAATNTFKVGITIFKIVMAFFIISAIFNVIFMIASGKGNASIATSIGFIFFIVISIIVIRVTRPILKHKKEAYTKADAELTKDANSNTNDDNKLNDEDDHPNFVEEYSANKSHPHKQSKPSNHYTLFDRLKPILLLGTLAMFIIVLLVGAGKSNVPMVIAGFVGFVLTIFLTIIISSIVANKNTSKKWKEKSAEMQQHSGTVKVCTLEFQSSTNGTNLNSTFKLVIEVNETFYVCYSKNEYKVGDKVTVYLDHKNKKKCYIDD